jgi:hypothetical protein
LHVVAAGVIISHNDFENEEIYEAKFTRDQYLDTVRMILKMV